MKLCQRVVPLNQAAQVGETWHLIELSEIHARDGVASFAIDMTCRDIVNDPVHPGLQAASAVKRGQALPQLEMHVLQQIEPPFGIGLCRPRQPLHGVRKLIGGLLVERICGLTRLHTGLSLGQVGFLTKFFLPVLEIALFQTG